MVRVRNLAQKELFLKSMIRSCIFLFSHKPLQNYVLDKLKSIPNDLKRLF